MQTKSLNWIGVVFLSLLLQNLYSQSVGIGTTSPDSSASLEVSAVDQGFLPPRLTTLQRDAISLPAEGLMIYNLDNKCLEYWNNEKWNTTCNSILYDKIMTSHWLNNNATFIETPALDTINDFLRFGIGSTVNGKLFEVPLLDAGVLSNVEHYIVEIVFSRSQILIPADNDIAFGISDGTNFVGFGFADNPGKGFVLKQAESGSQFAIEENIETNGTFTARLAKAQILLEGDASTWGGMINLEYENVGTVAKTYTRNIVPANGLKLEVYRDSEGEEYVIDFIHLQIRREVK